MKALIVIPARSGSTRFPYKPLAKIAGTTMIERVWNIAKSVPLADHVVISTDNTKIKENAENFGAKVIMTSDCNCGTDRVAQTIQLLNDDYDVILNLQGDAVLTPPFVIDQTLKAILQDPTIEIATPMVTLTGEKLSDFVKLKKQGSTTGTTVVFDKNNNALYFSKTIIPHYRDNPDNQLIYKHIGLYAYRKDTLINFSKLPMSTLEKTEKLEQLRALENGIPIKMVLVDNKERTLQSVNSPSDIITVEEIIKKEGELI